MPKRKAVSAPPEIATQLSRFVLIKIVGKNDLAGTGTGRVDLTLEKDIGLETIAPDDKTGFCRIVVRIKLAFAGRREKDEIDSVRVEGEYEGRFKVHPDVTIDQLDQIAPNEKFQYGLVSQVYPLATTHLREQLQIMGMSPRHFPLGI